MARTPTVDFSAKTLIDTRALLDALTACAASKKPPREALATLAPFEHGSLDPSSIDIDELREYVGKHYDRVASLCAHRSHPVRYAALWSLGGASDQRAAAVIVHALLHPLSWIDHDFAYMAAAQLRARGVAWFTEIALDAGPAEREAALSCIGLARSPDVAIAALERVAERHGPSAALYNALYNLHDTRALSLAIAGLGDESPVIRCGAVGVVHECVRRAREQSLRLSLADTAIAQAVEQLFTDPRTWLEPGDPWASTWTWALAVLVLCNPATAERIATYALRANVHSERRREAFAKMRELPLTPSLERAVIEASAAGTNDSRLSAAMILTRSADAAKREAAFALLHRKVVADGRMDELWHDVVDVMGERAESVERWIEAAKKEQKKSSSIVRKRVAKAIAHVASIQDDDGAWITAVLARCDARLASAVRAAL